ncbi:aspartate/glutamate racemase family protein [Alicyclobacillus fastidiosus]|uniref:Aspartate/glutamate racemase family protein n=1 Tax=Alicyclobacillus fastidiosus TaxID=392011 RepID=A0ABV5ALN9_9BACL|nr:aspartate/glutamate racemase family protein [Alicyclobacillus fastidiosus]WEH08044.1 aspartate/glutamate racemase family protein [Alicyclobacillus fastidiosus]
MSSLAIIHTTPLTIQVLTPLASELLPNCELMNFLDDTILPELRKNGGDLTAVAPRWLQYAAFAEHVGADCILSACSSVGPLVERASGRVPIVRIDEPMAELAIERGQEIGVAATLPTTLNPTTELLRHKAKRAGKSIRLTPVVVDEAYRRLLKGDKAGHDEILSEKLLYLAESTDVVLLAQASMAQVVETLPEHLQAKFLTSPRLGLLYARQVMEGLA